MRRPDVAVAPVPVRKRPLTRRGRSIVRPPAPTVRIPVRAATQAANLRSKPARTKGVRRSLSFWGSFQGKTTLLLRVGPDRTQHRGEKHATAPRRSARYQAPRRYRTVWLGESGVTHRVVLSIGNRTTASEPARPYRRGLSRFQGSAASVPGSKHRDRKAPGSKPAAILTVLTMATTTG
jgi:hypothetical protein